MRRMYELLLTSATATDSHVDIPLYPIHLVSCETFLLCIIPYIRIKDYFHSSLFAISSAENITVGLTFVTFRPVINLTIRIPKSCLECSNQTKRNVFCIITTIYETLTYFLLLEVFLD